MQKDLEICKQVLHSHMASSTHIPKLCLNMIVKNESKIIKRLFDSVCAIIDSYCICDTGSTDDTPTIIQEYFEAKGIPGKVIQEPFRDFGYNRTHSLLACAGMADADYILLMDADMILEPGNGFNKQMLNCADAHYVFQGSPNMSYKNVRIVKNNIGIKYWGVTHEVIETPPNSVYSNIEKSILFINDVGDGGAKADKYERDIRLLLRGLEEKPNNDRYTFYLANSYRENGEKQKAIETYKKRIEIGGWIEEIWQSYYNIGKCYQALGEHEKALASWLEGYDKFPDRLENIYEIMTHYRVQSKHRLVYELYRMVKRTLDKTRGKTLDHLFVQNDVYDYKIDYEYTISGYYCNPEHMDIGALCMRVMATPNVDQGIIQNVLSNYKFYAEKIKKNCRQLNISPSTELEIQSENGFPVSLTPRIVIKSYPDFYNSTPTMCYLNEDQILINVRYVNYRIDDKGNYINGEHIETKNVMTIYDRKTGAVEKHFVLDHDRELDDVYVGLEDVRLFQHKGKVHFTANRGLPDSKKGAKMTIEFGTINLETGKTESYVIFGNDGMKPIEKNWTLYAGVEGELKMVYGWYPFTLYEPYQGKKIVVQNCSSLPPFFAHVRGSCNGIKVGSETWFLCHTVSYEDRRYYYHIIIALDNATGKVKRWTKYFTLEGKQVEYVLGFLYDEKYDDFLLGYSTMDKTTEVVKIYKGHLDVLFV